MSTLKQVLTQRANPARANVSARFFKTGPGEYGEGDIFIGLDVPTCRSIARDFSHIELDALKTHLHSPIHEERLVACLILVEKYKKSKEKEKLIAFYLANLQGVNNWDLVDSTADKLLGEYLITSGKMDILDTLAGSKNIWERRVAMVSTLAFTRNGNYEPVQHISLMLMNDSHDLIHKAMGWMLREMGKRDEKTLKDFLKEQYSVMPRTALRYAIERFSPAERKRYLEGSV